DAKTGAFDQQRQEEEQQQHRPGRADRAAEQQPDPAQRPNRDAVKNQPALTVHAGSRPKARSASSRVEWIAKTWVNPVSVKTSRTCGLSAHRRSSPFWASSSLRTSSSARSPLLLRNV